MDCICGASNTFRSTNAIYRNASSQDAGTQPAARRWRRSSSASVGSSKSISPISMRTWSGSQPGLAAPKARSRLSKHVVQPASWSRADSLSRRLLWVKRTLVAPSASSKSTSIRVSRSSSSQDPGERQAGRAVDLGVAAAAAVLVAGLRVAHHHPDGSADAQVDLGVRRFPVDSAVEPAPQHLLAGPGVEDRLGGGLEGALEVQGLAVHRSRSFWRRRRSGEPGPRHEQTGDGPGQRGEKLLHRHAGHVGDDHGRGLLAPRWESEAAARAASWTVGSSYSSWRFHQT